jgi:Aspartyl protease
MSNLKLLTSITLAFCTATTLNGERHCPGNVPSVPLRQVQGAVNVVSVYVNGAGPFDFLVDTGAQTATVDDQLASELDLAQEGKTHVSGLATYASKPYTYLAKLEIGGGQVNGVLAVIDDLAELHQADRRIRGIVGENFLTHFDLLIDNQHHALCLDNTGAMAAAMKGTRVPLAHPYGTNHDLAFMRPIVIEAHLEAILDPVLFRLDSGTNAPVIYGSGKGSLGPVRENAQVLKRFVNGAEQDFAVMPPRDLSVGGETIRQVIFVQTMNSIGGVQQTREDGVLPTQMFRRVFVSYMNHFAILDLR